VASSNFQQWLQQGDSIYQTALKEFHAIEGQLDELEARLLAKQAEVNQIAAVLNKPTVEATRKGVNGDGQSTAVAAVPQIMDEIERSQPAPSNANIARALTGRFGR